MRKLIAVAFLVGGLLGMAGPAMAQNPGGLADPLSLAASGVLMPFFGFPGDIAVLEVTSPVGDNSDLHMFFFNANCNRVEQSHFLPVTENGVAFLTVVGDGTGFGNPNGGVLDGEGFFGSYSPTNGGLITIARTSDSFTLAPLATNSPIHSRMFVFNPSNGSSRFIEPIILDAAEGPGDPHTWSPLRTAVTFFAPQEGFVFPSGGVLKNRLWLICPRNTIVQPPYFSPTFDPVTGGGGFPDIFPHFPSGFSGDLANGSLRAVIFDADEKPLVDVHTSCDCVRTVDNILDISPIYATAAAVNGTFTKLETNALASSFTSGGGPPNKAFAFTGYHSTSSSPINDFFGRLYDGSYLTIDAATPSGVTTGQR